MSLIGLDYAKNVTRNVIWFKIISFTNTNYVLYLHNSTLQTVNTFSEYITWLFPEIAVDFSLQSRSDRIGKINPLFDLIFYSYHVLKQKTPLSNSIHFRFSDEIFILPFYFRGIILEARFRYHFREVFLRRERLVIEDVLS